MSVVIKLLGKFLLEYYYHIGLKRLILTNRENGKKSYVSYGVPLNDFMFIPAFLPYAAHPTARCRLWMEMHGGSDGAAKMARRKGSGRSDEGPIGYVTILRVFLLFDFAYTPRAY